MVIIYLWYVCVFVQSLMGLGTAYRLTRNGGDNGVALWGWMLVTNLAALVPGLGVYMWMKNRDDAPSTQSTSSGSGKKPKWMTDEEKNQKPNTWRDY